MKIKPVDPGNAGPTQNVHKFLNKKVNATTTAPVKEPKNNTNTVAYKIPGNLETPPQAIVVNRETGRTKPIVPQNPRAQAAVDQQIQSAKKVVQNPPPESPIGQGLNVTA